MFKYWFSEGRNLSTLSTILETQANFELEKVDLATATPITFQELCPSPMGAVFRLQVNQAL